MSSVEEVEVQISAAGMTSFAPEASSYRCNNSSAALVPLSDIQTPPARTAIEPTRAQAILAAIRRGEALPPVTVTQPAGVAPDFRLHDGFHRYHLSAALGFTHIPVQRHWDDL